MRCTHFCCHIKENNLEMLSALSFLSCTYPFSLQTRPSVLKSSRCAMPLQLMRICKFWARLRSVRAADVFLNLSKNVIVKINHVLHSVSMLLTNLRFPCGRKREGRLSWTHLRSSIAGGGNELLIYFWFCNMMQLLHMENKAACVDWMIPSEYPYSTVLFLLAHHWYTDHNFL